MSRASTARRIADTHVRFRARGLAPGTCTPDRVARHVQQLLSKSNGAVTLVTTGSSIERRPIHLLRYGRGPVRILLWSQMHGDEPTATLAMMDMFGFLTGGGAGMGKLAEQCTIYAVPMLNPDGAARGIRHTATGIDMNRDARRLKTPEARFLRAIQRRIRPNFGFNLHDQELSTVGASKTIAAIALLAPAAGPGGRMTPVRRRGAMVAGTIARVLEPFAPGQIARYDDAHEPRAFGDMMQAWGTSTVLIESGHRKGDQRRETIRFLNYVGLLSALHAIGTGSIRPVSIRQYLKLQTNGKRAYDIILRGVRLSHGRRFRTMADIGIRTTGITRLGAPARGKICEVGDLTDFAAIIDVPGAGRPVRSEKITLDHIMSMSMMARRLGFPVSSFVS